MRFFVVFLSKKYKNTEELKQEILFQFEEMKKRLSSEGLFDDEHKKQIPPFPKRIGIITSPEAAAVAAESPAEGSAESARVLSGYP